MWEEKLTVYDELVSKCPRFERKGKTMIYTSANGHMFSLLNKAGEIGIRFSKEVQKKYIEEFDSSIYKSYNSIMHGYVLKGLVRFDSMPSGDISFDRDHLTYAKASMKQDKVLKPDGPKSKVDIIVDRLKGLEPPKYLA